MQDGGYNPTFGEIVNEEFKNRYYDENGNEIMEDDMDDEIETIETDSESNEGYED